MERRWPARSFPQLENEPAGRLAANTGHGGEELRVLAVDRHLQRFWPYAGQDRQRQSGSDAGDADERLEQSQLIRRGESIEGELILAHVEVREQSRALAGLADILQGDERGVDAVDDSTDVDQRRVVQLALDASLQSRDHSGIPTLSSFDTVLSSR